MISILYIDDEKTLLDVTRTYLERTGEFTVTTCLSAVEALELLKTRSFDAIVSDYQMPVMDGILFLKRLRDAGDAVPFILFTGRGREQVAIEALNSGADFYLQKGGEPKSQFAELTNKIKQAVQRRQAEIALVVSEEKYRELVEKINDVIFTLGEDDRFAYISPRVSQFGYSVEEVINRPVSDFVDPHDIATIQEQLTAENTGVLKSFEFMIRDGNGENRYVRASLRTISVNGRIIGTHGILTDITGQKTAEMKISASEQRYRNVFEASGEAMLVLDDNNGTILDANPAAVDLFGIPSLTAMNYTDLWGSPDPAKSENLTEISKTPLCNFRKGDGTLFPATVLSTTYPQEKRTIRILSIRDLTEQKRAEERVAAAQRLYAVLSQINQTIVRMKDLETLVAEICRISVEFGHFQMSWVGLLDRQSHTFRPVAWAGNEDGYLRDIEITVTGDEKSMGPTGTALRNGTSDICNNIATDPRMEPWRQEALKRGYRSSAAVPFRLHGDIVGAYMIYASHEDFFNKAEMALLEEIASDISFALDMLDERARRTKAEQALAGSVDRERFLAGVLELSSQPFGVAYPGGKFGIVNPALCDLLGYTEEELRTMSWMKITAPESAEREAEVLAELAHSGIPQRYEKEYIRKDGTRLPVETFVHRVTDEGGNIRYYYGFITDISERRKNQKLILAERDRAQLYLDTADVMLAAVAADGTITLINRKGCRILGYSEGELIGRNWLDTCLPERIRNEVSDLFFKIIAGEKESVAYHENAVLTRNGEERILAFHNSLIKDEDLTITGVFFSGEDITERRRAERGLQESEERFRNLIQNSTEMIRIIGKDGLIKYSSPSTLRITGIDPADMIGKNPLDFVHPDDREVVAAALGEVMDRTNPGIPTEYRIRHADGSYQYVETIATNLIDVSGIGGIVTTAWPITERKRAEEALQESEGRYRAIFEKSEDAILVKGDGRILDANAGAERLFGYSREELLSLTTRTTFSPVNQPCGRASEEMASGYFKAAWGGALQTFSWTFCTRDGRVFPGQLTLIPAQVQGKPRLIMIISDRSAQERDERQFRHLARFPELNPDPVIEICLDKEIRYANPSARTTLRQLGMPEDPHAFLPEDFDEIIIALQARTPHSLSRVVRIGTALFSETLALDPDDHTIRIFARDITTMTFEKDALGQATRRLNFLAHISRHDVKNKLTGVMGYLELARGSAREPDLIEYISRAEISANAIRDQVEFTKEYENLGVNVPEWQPVSLLIKKAAALLDLGAVTVQDETRGLVIYADPMLERVLTCLMENALAHGGKVTRIRINGVTGAAGYLLVVEDDGVGIPVAQKEKIFNKKIGKAGCPGLFLSREILSITGITIEETGTPGSGARFELMIPIGKFQIKSFE